MGDLPAGTAPGSATGTAAMSPVTDGTVVVDFTVNGVKDPAQCQQGGATTIDITVQTVDGALGVVRAAADAAVRDAAFGPQVLRRVCQAAATTTAAVAPEAPDDAPTTGVALADAAEGSGGSSPDALKAAQAHAQGWSMEHLAERYVDVYERAIAAYKRGEHC